MNKTLNFSETLPRAGERLVPSTVVLQEYFSFLLTSTPLFYRVLLS
jgi:hypothetical protein